MSAAQLLDVADLRVSIQSTGVELVRGIGFQVAEGESVGLVGESGSGKSVTATTVLGLNDGLAATGSVSYRGEQLLAASPDRLRELRGSEIALITQDALTALDPVFTVGFQMAEAVHSHRRLGREQTHDLSTSLLREVGISDGPLRLKQFPHQLSGGMRQRVLLAIGLLNEPRLLVADEPTTALDVTIQAQLMRLLARETRVRGMAMLMITHDLRLVAGLCDRLVVMYAGRIVESGPAKAVYSTPAHPYTRALLACADGLNSPRGTRAFSIPGRAPNPGHALAGCPFAPRCASAIDRCHTEQPQRRELSEGRFVECHLA